jgi:short-subunit dehydrogenase
MQLRDRNVWLIGASTGIGAAMVPLLVREGARLAISSRRESELEALATRYTAGHTITVKPLDVTDKDAIARVADELRAQWGRIDVLIYNAGAWAPIDVTAFDAEAFQQQIDVNFTGMMRAIVGVLPGMLERKSGDIVGVASLSAYGAFPRAEAYGSTKAAVNYMLQSLRFDLKTHGIGVVTVNPGFVDTDLTRDNDFPMPFLMKPEDAAREIITGMKSGAAEVHFPKRLSFPLKLLTALPRPLYDVIAARFLKG